MDWLPNLNAAPLLPITSATVAAIHMGESPSPAADAIVQRVFDGLLLTPEELSVLRMAAEMKAEALRPLELLASSGAALRAARSLQTL